MLVFEYVDRATTLLLIYDFKRAREFPRVAQILSTSRPLASDCFTDCVGTLDVTVAVQRICLENYSPIALPL